MQDLWLLKLDSQDAASAAALARTSPSSLRLWRALEAPLMYACLWEPPSPEVPASTYQWARLQCVQALAGASPGETPRFHYIVETDVLPQAEDDFNAWYGQEHLPGLAAVPGVVRAARYVDAGGSPRYYACYDLAGLEAFGSAPWLAVRETAWSSRVRPSFRNTRRTMFRLASESAGRG
ncbi:MAG: hypothetical protein JSS56_24930 [Proteobacteria bacterium]|nr:hypothetical protein [Pseudomonadota bacterium]